MSTREITELVLIEQRKMREKRITPFKIEIAHSLIDRCLDYCMHDRPAMLFGMEVVTVPLFVIHGRPDQPEVVKWSVS